MCAWWVRFDPGLVEREQPDVAISICVERDFDARARGSRDVLPWDGDLGATGGKAYGGMLSTCI